MNFIEEKFTFQSTDGRDIVVYKWFREKQEINGVVQIAHGMAETAARYKRFAESLTQAGFIVYANDHRGHGESADSIDNQGYLGEKNGFKLLINDIAQLTTIIAENYPLQPIFLFSHSMGSFAAQRYIMDYPQQINGLILAGSNGEQGYKITVAKTLAQIEQFFRGKKSKSHLLNHLIFDAYNQQFHPQTTGFEWITSNQEEMIKYIENPYCGQVFPASFYYEFLSTLEYIEDTKNFHKLPLDLPIFIISGDQDPVGDFGDGVKKLYARYERLGVKDLEMKLYAGARHELLNETNYGEVTTDIIEWLIRKMDKRRNEYAKKIN